MDTFYEQIGNRVVEDIANNHGYCDIEEAIEHLQHLSISSPPVKHLRCGIFRVTQHCIESKIVNQKKFVYLEWKNDTIYQNILSFVKKYIFPNTNEKDIILYTEYAVK